MRLQIRTISCLMLIIFLACIPPAYANESISLDSINDIPFSDQSVIIIDDYGSKVIIKEEPHRIASLSPANTEILFSLGLGDRVIAVTDWCTYPPEAQEKERIGGYNTISIEKVIAQQPDLIVAADGNPKEVISTLKDLGFTVIVLNPLNIQDVMKDIELLGCATDSQKEADLLVEDMHRRITAVEERTGQSETKPKVAHIIWNDPIWVSGNNTFQDIVIHMAGGTNAFPQVEEWGTISFEEFILNNPDVIIVNSGTGMDETGEDLLYEYFINEPRMQGVSAVKNERVYIVDSDIIDRGGPRIVDALEIVAAYIHPDLFNEDMSTPINATQTPGFGIQAVFTALICTLYLILKRGAA
jgi:iron complex transport system substrate-binding protein